ncbi:hypothetical protein CYY_001715 [Polysphondylium violaceum]|uniref:Glycoside hydrolase family 5 domain-containing protein n=1 Tax=Polysphondylium violaceum TaxID=133409 RepID=A0A8J4Q8X1_9MYCE|nr:hypothetical protein CYY_001715 [Polysphondylium violaceum]
MLGIFKKVKYYWRRKKIRQLRKKQQKNYDNKESINGANQTNGNAINVNINQANEETGSSTIAQEQQTTSPKQVSSTNNNSNTSPVILSKNSSSPSLSSPKKVKVNINSSPTPLNIIQEDPVVNISKNSPTTTTTTTTSSPQLAANNNNSNRNSPTPNSPSIEDQISEYKRLQRERYEKQNSHTIANNSSSNNRPSNNNNLPANSAPLATQTTTQAKPLKSILKRSRTNRLKMNVSEYQQLYFSSKDGGLWINDLPLKLKGINWFGFETETAVVHGLWARDYKSYLDLLAENHFNVIRIPFSLEVILNDPFPTSINISPSMNTEFYGLRALSVMDMIIEGAGERGIFVLLDLHSLKANDRMNEGLWYTKQYSEHDVLRMWELLVLRYSRVWNVIGVDLKNEPFSATWNSGNASTDWDKAINKIGAHIQNRGGNNWLIFGQGVHSKSHVSCWGESFEQEGHGGASTVSLPLNDKFVYSPHAYGPSVVNHDHFHCNDFPNNLPSYWDKNFGLLSKNTGRAIVVGEWGGKYQDQNDKVWMDEFVNYLISRNITDNMFWCLNPNSGDTGGILQDDWCTLNENKLNLLHKLVPHPTRVELDKDTQLFTVTSIIPTSQPEA